MQTQAFINNQWCDGTGTFDVKNPFDGSVIASVASCGAKEAVAAVDAAQSVLPAWRDGSSADRSTLLLKWHELIVASTDELAPLMVQEMGMTLAEAKIEITYGCSFITWSAHEANRIYGESMHMAKGQQQITIKQGVGVVAAITPWNFPLAMITRKIAPALAAGCTVVVKPAQETPLTALKLAELAIEAGFPAGVINMVMGDYDAIGQAWCADSRVRALSFTGSIPVGKKLMAQCADTVKKVTLELGGNAPFIVFDDADIGAAVAGAVATKTRHNGEVCIASNRFYIHESVKAEFIEKLTAEFKKLKLGDGMDESNHLGPLINQATFDKVKRLVEDAVQQGATVVCGGKPVEGIALGFQPTVLDSVADDMAITQEEIFGPVVALQSFTDEANVLQRANATETGLASYVYTQDVSRVLRVSRALEFGMVGVNTPAISSAQAPFGGVKQSGLGREGSLQAIEEFLEEKYVCLA